MTMTGAATSVAPVRKSITVKASVERAFQVYTAELDSWWPRSHHLGTSPLATVMMEGRVNGRCYGVSVDGVETDWGRVLEWDPPHRLVMAWQITPQWTPESDLEKSSVVEVRFTAVEDGHTRVDLEHRDFHKHGAGGDSMRKAVDAPNGWDLLLGLFTQRV